MTLHSRSSRSLLMLSAFAITLAGLPLAANPIPVTYQFTGTCTDCTGTGVGMLTLVNYTLGNAFTIDNFVSFTYSSNLLSYSIPSTRELGLFLGSLPGGMPGVSLVDIQDTSGPNPIVFATSPVGTYWCAGTACGQDNGTSFIWSAAEPAVSPEPATLLMMSMALLGFGLYRRRLVMRS